MPNRAPGTQEKWLYTVTQVEEVKRMLGFVPIMISTIIFNTGAPLPCHYCFVSLHLQGL